MQIKAKHIKSISPFILLAVTILLQYIFNANNNLTERYYSTGIYPIIASTLSFLSSKVGFSIGDLFYLFLIVFFIVGIILLFIKKIRILTFLLRFFQIICIVYASFYFFWGFNYYRESAHARLSVNKTEANDSTFIKTFEYIINKTNESYSPTAHFNFDTLDSTLEASYQNNAEFLQLKYPSGTRRIKNISFSDFFAKATILGYYGPFFNETHINKHLTKWDIPVVSAHEKSHQFGITSEAEAGFYGWFVCVHSNDQFIEYSGWLYALDYFIYQSKDLSNRKKWIQKIRPEIIADIKAQNKHWRQWRNASIDKAASKVNDAYLKTNNVEKGIQDYNGVVQLIVDYLSMTS